MSLADQQERDIIQCMREEIMSDSLFEKVVKKKKLNNGSWEYSCPLGLWGVIAPTKAKAISEAAAYFMQYYIGGEYEGYKE